MFELPPLPYDHAALEPVIGRATMHLHHEKHHQKYVDSTNELLAKQGDAPASLEDVILKAAARADARKLFNNAAQLWNHTFFWTCMSAKAQTPTDGLAEAIDRDFGGLAELKAKFVELGAAHFGSGWVWVAAEGQTLRVIDTHDGENLLTHPGMIPLFVCDLWEHAYYLDHKNDRQAYLEGWFGALPNWAFAGDQYAAALGDGEIWRHPDLVSSSGTGAAEKRSNQGR